MKDADARIRKWNAKFNTQRVKEALDDQRPTMLAHVAAAYPALVKMEIDVKKILDMSSVSTILYVAYLDFGRQLYKLSRQRGIAGDSLRLAAQVLLEKWRDRGLDPDVLAVIRSGVFDIAGP